MRPDFKDLNIGKTMKARLVWLFLLCSVIGPASGCKRSAESASTVGTGTPRPQKPAVPEAAPLQKAAPAVKVPAGWAPPPDLENAVPAKTFQVQAPASFTTDQVPENSVVEFRFTAKAGQVLHICMHEGEWFMLVKGPGIGQHGLIPGGDSEGNRLYTLPETGAYEIVGQRTTTQGAGGNNPVIQLALLNIDDPLVDPGIRPEQISLQGGGLAANAKWSLIPYSHFDGYADDPWPSHLALAGAHLEFRVMPVAGYKKIVSSEDMDKLQSALQADGRGADPRKFPYSGHNDAALEVASRPKLLHGEGWRGLRWIGQYSQDYVCGFRHLTYVFEGISDDGKLFFMMQRGVSNLDVAIALDKACTEMSRGKNRVEDLEALFNKEMPALFDKEISAADPASFSPGLDQLDAIALSLKLKR